MKDYDAIAREIYIPSIFSTPEWNEAEIQRITAILRKHDEAEASGELPDAEGEIDSYIDMGAFRDPKVARPYLIDGYRLGYGAGKEYARSRMRPAPTDEKALVELYNWIETKHGDLPASKLSMQDRQEITSILAREAPKDIKRCCRTCGETPTGEAADCASKNAGSNGDCIHPEFQFWSPKDESKVGGR